MVTKEEEHSTRGRAHLLFEMMQGQEIAGLWRSDAVKEALDLCLACKGCKGDCPVNVDMATLKAEFLSHYYKGRLRPRSAYAFGLIYWAARAASRAPALSNFFMQVPPFSNLSKWLAGATQKRRMPRFASETFREWVRKNERSGTAFGNRKVILWADTFNNHFLPKTLIAGYDVLTAAGFQVIVPQKQLCCGRPLYDFGMLDLARRQLRQIMTALRDEISAGIPIVGLEPSCVAVFRDELGNLFPNDEDAKRLRKQTFTLAEFLTREAPEFAPRISRKAIVHRHCHHQAIMKFDADEKLMKKMGLDFEVLDSGCCGMAGYFGYEQGEPYEVSIAAGERALLPAVRKEPYDSLVMADGFSCREQIEQQTDRHPLHLAEVIRQALEPEGKSPAVRL
jgi:Fe-S oxidoreductase